MLIEAKFIILKIKTLTHIYIARRAQVAVRARARIGRDARLHGYKQARLHAHGQAMPGTRVALAALFHRPLLNERLVFEDLLASRAARGEIHQNPLTYIARRAAVAVRARARVGRDALPVDARLHAHGQALPPLRVRRVALAAFLHRPLLDERLSFEDLLEFDLVSGTPRWHVEAPRVFLHLVRLLLRYPYCCGVPRNRSICILKRYQNLRY